jgi:serine/threonine-protein kinase
MLDTRIGNVVGGYRLVEEIGRGGSSVVYRAEHVRLGRPAALKLLTPALAEEGFRERFVRESKLAASLDHPSIVPVFDAGDDDGVLYLAMACVDGSDLKTLLVQEGRLPLRRALRIVGQIGSALDAAHARGLVHRDVKPANILVGRDDRAFLSDFGVVKELAAAGVTRAGSFVGTIEYCAPEQIEGRDVDARADQYALACVLYECLVGVSPFHRSSDVAVLNAHLHAAPPRLSRAAPDLPAELEPVLAKALSKSPLDRYASCGEFFTAARAAVSAPRADDRRFGRSVALLGAAAVLGAAFALAVAALVHHDRVDTRTVVVKQPAAAAQASLDQLMLKSTDGRTLNDAAYYLLGAGEWERAIPFAYRALQFLPHSSLTYTYATFNLGYGLYEAGRCREALPYLKRAVKSEPTVHNRKVAQAYVKKAKACLQGAASGQAPSPSQAGVTGPSAAR